MDITITISLQELCERLELEQFLDKADVVKVTQADDQDGKVTITFES